MYGNVFAIINESSQINTFHELIQKKVTKQKLSVTSSLKDEYKSFIVERLKEGIVNFDRPDFIPSGEFDIVRRYTLILLKDIIDNKDTLITNEFGNYLPNSVRNEIIEQFACFKDFIDDDINTSLDQVIKLTKAIDSGLEYPHLHSETRFDDIVAFLEKLCDIFNWDKYDKELSGNVNYFGKHPIIKRHAVALNKWLYGMTINEIINDSIKYYNDPNNKMTLRFAKTKEERELIPDPWYKDVPYNDSKEHRNKLINDTLKEIEHIILFKFSNYFHKFSSQYKKLKNVEHLKNDWYEYVEYGTTEGLVIFLQQIGFTRETSLFIFRNSSIYISYENSETKLNKSLLECEDESIANEAMMVYKNIKDIFKAN